MIGMSAEAQSCLLLTPLVLKKEAEELVQQHLTARLRGWGADACECQLLVVFPTSLSVFEAQLLPPSAAGDVGNLFSFSNVLALILVLLVAEATSVKDIFVKDNNFEKL